MKQAVLITLALLAITVLLQLLPRTQPNAPDSPAIGMPWQITVRNDGLSNVFGLTLERSTLNDAEDILSIIPEIAIVGKRDEAGSLEAYFDGVTLNGLNARLIATIDVSANELQAMQQRSPKTDYMESTTRRSQLASADRDLARRLPLRALTLLPAGRLDPASITQRFGEPAERIKTTDDIEHFLYPARGVDVAINASGKTVVQYVAPAQFHRLRDPLVLVRSPLTAAGREK
jgi:hypothetical protein